MYHLVEAETWKGVRRFLIAADTPGEAAADMIVLLERGAPLMDESGEWFQPFDIDPETLAPRGVQPPPRSPAAVHYTNDGQRMV